MWKAHTTTLPAFQAGLKNSNPELYTSFLSSSIPHKAQQSNPRIPKAYEKKYRQFLTENGWILINL
ncbi:MAG: hypothetical protein LBP34_07760 [Flavobacteriaceae bacterium]|nr:hypothetical protein [Flavobacteriaceae bacterium]